MMQSPHVHCLPVRWRVMMGGKALSIASLQYHCMQRCDHACPPSVSGCSGWMTWRRYARNSPCGYSDRHHSLWQPKGVGCYRREYPGSGYRAVPSYRRYRLMVFMSVIAVQPTECTNPQLSRSILGNTLYTAVRQILSHHKPMFLILVNPAVGLSLLLAGEHDQLQQKTEQEC